MGQPPVRLEDTFSFPLSGTVKVLGATLDRFMTLDEHFSTIISKALVR